MQIETELKISFTTTIGDDFGDETPDKEEIEDAVKTHIEDYCKEHNIDFCDIKIVKQRRI